MMKGEKELPSRLFLSRQASVVHAGVVSGGISAMSFTGPASQGGFTLAPSQRIGSRH